MNRLMIGTAAAFTALSALTTACGGGDKGVTPPDTTDTTVTPPPPPPPPPVAISFAMAGNITNASPGASGAATTANLIGTLDTNTIVVPLGDNAPTGTFTELEQLYSPTWGRFIARTRAVAGNREYQNYTDAAGHFQYFGAAAGTDGKGWYSFDRGNWHIVVLNVHDNVTAAQMAEQLSWLSTDLAANTKTCTMVMYHNGRFLSSNDSTGGGWTVRGNQLNLWNMLYGNNVDLVVNGGEHQYERFFPMDPSGARDDAKGITQITVGTGGNSIYASDRIYVHPGRAAYIRSLGVLKVTLNANSADFAFLNATNPQATDAGTVTCH